MERPNPNLDDVIFGQGSASEFIIGDDVGLPSIASPSRLCCDDAGCACLGDGEEMNCLDSGTKQELDPEVPLEGEVFFNEAADDWANDRATDRRENDKGNCVLLSVRAPHVGNHTERYAATSRRQTTESAEDKHHGIVWGQGTGYLPEVDKEQTQLEYFPSSEFFAPGCPELAAECFSILASYSF
jgi:hypothetical protein